MKDLAINQTLISLRIYACIQDFFFNFPGFSLNEGCPFLCVRTHGCTYSAVYTFPFTCCWHLITLIISCNDKGSRFWPPTGPFSGPQAMRRSARYACFT